MDIILDTDIGNDCDDAGAVAVLHNLKKDYNLNILAMGSSSSRKDGAEALNIINDYYGTMCDVGFFTKKGFFDDNKVRYTQIITSEYSKRDTVDDYCHVFRKALVKAKDDLIIFILGPMNAFCDFMKSTADNISPLSGTELINSKAKHVYIMGGKFSRKPIPFEDMIVVSEWNIKVDIKSAQYVLNNLKCNVTMIPFDLGLVLTGKNLFNNTDNPVTRSYEWHSHGERNSWDPITVYYGITKDNVLFKESKKGIISISDDGMTSIKYCNDGNHTYLKNKKSLLAIKEKIDKYLY